MVKAIGALSLLLVAALISLRGARAYRERIAQMEGFLLLLRHIREHIACFRTPTHKILATFEHEALARCGFTVSAAGEGMLAALTGSRGGLYLEEEELSILTEFSEGLGRGYVEEELARCDLAIRRLGDALESRRELLPKSAKLFRTLVLSSTLAVIIVLI